MAITSNITAQAEAGSLFPLNRVTFTPPVPTKLVFTHIKVGRSEMVMTSSMMHVPSTCTNRDSLSSPGPPPFPISPSCHMAGLTVARLMRKVQVHLKVRSLLSCPFLEKCVVLLANYNQQTWKGKWNLLWPSLDQFQICLACPNAILFFLKGSLLIL